MRTGRRLYFKEKDFTEILVQWIIRQGLPCLFQFIIGLYRPGCGGTGVVGALLHENLRMSFQYYPLILCAVLALTVELISFALSRASKDSKWYLGHEALFVYIVAGIVVVNWIYKNAMLVFFGIDLLSLWSQRSILPVP